MGRKDMQAQPCWCLRNWNQKKWIPWSDSNVVLGNDFEDLTRYWEEANLIRKESGHPVIEIAIIGSQCHLIEGPGWPHYQSYRFLLEYRLPDPDII